MEETVKLRLRGMQVLNHPLFNKGTAFTQKERDALHLNGLLPSHISSVEEQLQRCHINFSSRRTPLGKYIYLLSLLNKNEVLFYLFLERYASETLPFIYTPTVGEASMQYSMLFTHQRGVYISYPLMDRMDEMIDNLAQEEVQVVVATDGERILGLGDQGIGGLAISIGKLSLYTSFGGIHPAKTLPIILDVGTNNPHHLQNEFYIGWRHPRLQGEEYDRFIDTFVTSLKRRYPKALLQWEDFGKNNATRLMTKYRPEILSFNDDIQGTGAVTLAALFAGVQITKSRLSDQRIAILGGGSAGTGIATMILNAMIHEGLSEEEAKLRIFIVDVSGLLHTNSTGVEDHQKRLLYPIEALRHWTISNPEIIALSEVIANAHPTVLIGACGQPGAFKKEMIQEMASHVERPIVFPLSNPTSKAECTPGELIEWTHGKAIIATGSPFVPVSYLGKTFEISQCNNVYIFPGLGLGALAAQATQITDGMIQTAAHTLANHSPALQGSKTALFPSISEVRSVSRQIAIGVANQAWQEKVGHTPPKEIEQQVDALMWKPHYPTYTAG